MELYLQFFFFSEFTISKNLISPLSTKKSTYRKRTHKKFVVLALLPKIDRIRLTKTPRTKRRAREPAAHPRPPCPARPPRNRARRRLCSPRHPRRPQSRHQRLRLLSPSQHPLSNNDYVKQKGEGGEVGKKKRKKPLNINSYTMVRLLLDTQRIRTTWLRDYVKMLRKNVVWRGLKRGGGTHRENKTNKKWVLYTYF